MEGRMRLMTALYLERGGKLLLLYRIGSRVGPPSWRGVGGHVEPEEIGDARACVLRELEEETLFRREMLEHLRLKYVALRRKNGEIWQNFYFFATLRADADVELACNEGELAWFLPEAALACPMPPSAKAALAHYYAGGRADDAAYVVAATADGAVVTKMEEF